ncbi:SAM-dependent methyltransferase [Plantactinospora sp. GCM10030261]|uniref:SAM-dependent methyltransferase n=1 Tax=Plantactinospora sp. GCM10030261 TaxID=3273420 RepID=UPI00361183C0
MSQSSTEDPTLDAAPSGVDTSVPHSARVYDWWLGGKDNFAVDRQMGAALVAAIPTLRDMAAENRRFVHRAARYLVAEAGVRQFLDIGTGIPTRPNLHDVAQAIAPETRVVYVDNDPIVLAHARALMDSTPQGRSEYIHADLREPGGILADDALRATLDLDRPVALTLIAVLMLLRDSDDPAGIIRTLADALPSGSYLAITHPTQDFNPAEMDAAVAAATHGGMTLVPRARDEVERLFLGWDLVEPGLVPVMAWQPETPPSDPTAAYYWAGLARKP